MVHPDRLLEQLTMEQWLDWVAYDRISPVGDERGDLLLSRLALAWSAKGATLEDMLPRWGDDGEDELEFLRRIVRDRNGHAD